MTKNVTNTKNENGEKIRSFFSRDRPSMDNAEMLQM